MSAVRWTERRRRLRRRLDQQRSNVAGVAAALLAAATATGGATFALTSPRCAGLLGAPLASSLSCGGLSAGLRRAPRRLSGAGTSCRAYDGVEWSSERWYWTVTVIGAPERGEIQGGDYDTEYEAAKAYDCLQLALDQAYPESVEQRGWRRNLPQETIYQDEVEAIAEQLGIVIPEQESPAPPPGRAPRFVAQFDRRGEEADELNFREGDVIEILDSSDEDWWKGRLNGVVGMVPANHLKPEER